MKINFEMVSSILGKYKPSVRISCKESSAIGEVDFLDVSRRTFEPNFLYLGRASDFSAVSKAKTPLNIVLVADCPIKIESIYNDMLNLIILDDFYDLEVLHKEILDYLKTRHDFWQKSLPLYEYLVPGKRLQALADKGGDLLGNPLLIVDTHFNVLAYSQQGFVNEFLWDEIIEEGFYPYEKVILAQKFGCYDKTIKYKDPVILRLPYMKNRFIGFKIVISSEIVGYINVLESSRTLEKNDFELLTLLCNLASIELQKVDDLKKTDKKCSIALC